MNCAGLLCARRFTEGRRSADVRRCLAGRCRAGARAADLLRAVTAVGLLAVQHPQASGIDARRVLLRESFGGAGEMRLPDGWSSSYSRFLLWPDFVVSGDASGPGDPAAVAESVSGEAWLMSPPLPRGTYDGVEVRCRVRASRGSSPALSLEVCSLDGSLRSGRLELLLAVGTFTEHRIRVDLRGWACPEIAVRWRVECDPPSRPATVRIDDVLILGLDPLRWKEWEVAATDTAPPRSLVVNEIMYAPRSSEPEWIELLNAGGSPVNVAGWTISDASGGRSSPFPAVIVPGEGTIVVTRDLRQFALARGEPACQPVAPGSMPSLNNGGDAVIVRTAGGVTTDSVAYAPFWGGAGGRSLERRDPRSPSSRENWGECEDSSGATPCGQNSIAALPVDVSLSLRPAYVFPQGTAASVDARLRNVGTAPVGNILVDWYIDEDQDGLPGEQEAIGHGEEAGPISPGDSLAVTAIWAEARPGTHRLIVRAEVSGDGRLANNVAHSVVTVGWRHGAVVVNEIMYQPLTGAPEYVELAAAEEPLELSGWFLQLGVGDDGEPEKLIALDEEGGEGVARGGVGRFVVVTSDSSILTGFPRMREGLGKVRLLVTGSALGLSNNGELIRLVDPSGGTVDSLRYDPGWHDPAFTEVSGRSLEKIHPQLEGARRESWSTAAAPEGGTPGMRNSIVAPVERRPSALSAAPNPFSPDGDGLEDHTVVTYRTSAGAAYTVIRIFDVSGRLVRNLMEREKGGYEGETVWDGRDDLSRRVRMGMYVLYLEARDASGSAVATAKTVVAVAGRL